MYCDLSIAERGQGPGAWDIQLHADGVTIALVASGLEFLRELRDFISETKGNPDLRDEPVGGGFRTMPDVICDVSRFFLTTVSVQKDGEYDDAYVVRVGEEPAVVMADVRGELLRALTDQLDQAIEDWL